MNGTLIASLIVAPAALIGVSRLLLAIAVTSTNDSGRRRDALAALRILRQRQTS